MEFISDLFASLVRPLAKAVKTVLPNQLGKNFEPDSNLGDAVGFLILMVFLALLIFALHVCI